ncbi:MAG: hypothetical protein V1691_03710 [Chloroflexota bacterium]
MDIIEEKVKALEDEFRTTKEELQDILLDIRTRLMEVQAPLRADLPARRKDRSRNDTQRGVEPHGNQG